MKVFKTYEVTGRLTLKIPKRRPLHVQAANKDEALQNVVYMLTNGDGGEVEEDTLEATLVQTEVVA